MIAIPLDKDNATTISQLYGNAPYFALLNVASGDFKVVENTSCGNGLDTAKYIKDSGVSSTIFYHMGEGVFNFLNENGVKVYSALKNCLSIEDIYEKLSKDKCELVTKSNCEMLLDPGTTTCKCECNN